MFMMEQFIPEETWLCTSQIYFTFKDFLNSRFKVTYRPVQFGTKFFVFKNMHIVHKVNLENHLSDSFFYRQLFATFEP